MCFVCCGIRIILLQNKLPLVRPLRRNDDDKKEEEEDKEEEVDIIIAFLLL
jgi:hypothetical protein